jgi:hypothetical protein
MIEDPPAPTDEQGALRYIEALIKDHELEFELQGSFKRDEEERRQQERIDKAVAMAVVEERKEWEEQLAKQKQEQEHWTQIILFCIIVAALVWAFLSD